jgi:hypothetical protein
MDRRRLGGGVQIGSSDGIEPEDVGEAVSRASKDCCLSEVDFGKIVLVGVGERGISRSVVKGGKDGILNLPSLWNNRCS